MCRSLLVILAVAGLSSWIARAERATNVAVAAPAAHGAPDDWVRTTTGWERRSALTSTPGIAPTPLHPGLVAGFQIAVSLLVLVAFPGRAVPVHATAPAPASQRRPARRHEAEVMASR